MKCPYCGSLMQRVRNVNLYAGWLCEKPTLREFVDLSTGKAGSCVARCGSTVAA